MFLLFGACLADDMFGALRAVKLSYSSLSALPLQQALEGPITFAFMVFMTLIPLHIFQWFLAVKVRRYYAQR